MQRTPAFTIVSVIGIIILTSLCQPIFAEEGDIFTDARTIVVDEKKYYILFDADAVEYNMTFVQDEKKVHFDIIERNETTNQGYFIITIHPKLLGGNYTVLVDGKKVNFTESKFLNSGEDPGEQNLVWSQLFFNYSANASSIDITGTSSSAYDNQIDADNGNSAWIRTPQEIAELEKDFVANQRVLTAKYPGPPRIELVTDNFGISRTMTEVGKRYNNGTEVINATAILSVLESKREGFLPVTGNSTIGFWFKNLEEPSSITAGLQALEATGNERGNYMLPFNITSQKTTTVLPRPFSSSEEGVPHLMVANVGWKDGSISYYLARLDVRNNSNRGIIWH